MSVVGLKGYASRKAAREDSRLVIRGNQETGQRMRKKFGFGAGIALTVAAVALGGCGKKKTIIQGSSAGELNNNGFPASAIAVNNLASDGGGFSENSQRARFELFTCKFNYTHPASDSPSTADKSGMFFFTTNENTSGPGGGREHVWVSYWNGSSFTPPQEITGEDRDESQTFAQTATRTHPAATVMIPMNTSGYVGNTGTANARVRANQGNWLILWDGNTFTQNQVLKGSSGSAGILQGTAVGPHHTFWSTVFIKNLASQPLATTNLIGNLAATGTANGPAITCNYGFQGNGAEVPTYRNGASDPGSNTGVLGGFTNSGGFLVKPAEDVVSFGAASDTFVGCSSFTSTNNNASGLATGNQIGTVGSGAFRYGPNTPSTNNNVSVGSASYEVGDSTSFIQLFWCQLVTSGTGLTRQSTTFVTTGGGSSVNLGPQYSLLTANFNLSSMTIAGAATPFAAADAANSSVVNAPVTRNTFTDARRASTQPFTNFTTYNNILFWQYQDTSLASSSTTGSVEALIVNNGSRILSTLAVIPGLNGDASTANANDITLLGATTGRHQILNNSDPSVSNPINVGEEFVDLNSCGGCGIIGPDEGQVDIVAFVLGQVTTNHTRGGGTQGNFDRELWAVALTTTGATAGSLQAFTNNPRRVSNHTPDAVQQNTSTNYTGLADAVLDLKIQPSRDGTYDVLAWRQVVGTSLNANLALFSTVYKVFRSVAVNGSATFTGTPPTLDQRFPTASPIQVNNASTLYSAGTRTGLGTGFLSAFASAPVAAYDFQGNISYKCGFQGDRTKMSILWLYADGTEDRLFVKLLTIGTGTLVTDNPTITATNEAEVDSTAAVPGVNVNNLVSGIQRSTFRFLPGSFGETVPTWSAGVYTAGGFPNGNPGGVGFPSGSECSGLSPSTDKDGVLSVDAGLNATGGAGDVLLVFSKVVSATNNAFDRQVIAALYNQSTISDRVVISKAGVESSGQQPGGTPVTNNVTGFKTSLLDLNPNTSSNSLQTAAKVADNGVYIYMTGPVSTNFSSPRALFTRHFRARRATQGGTAVTFANTFFPPASAATGDAAFRAPIRIDVAQNSSDAAYVGVLKKARQAVVLFTQDNHLWGTVTADGESYTNTGGQSDAFLADNNISANQSAFGNSIKLNDNACFIVDSNCDNLSGFPLFFIKDDVNLNDRLYVRVMQ